MLPERPDAIEPADDDLGTFEWAASFWGGTDKPLNVATIYRWSKRGLIPPPRRIGPNTTRFVKSEQRAARAALLAKQK